MELVLERKIRSKKSTIGNLTRLTPDGHGEDLGFILEDVDRGLKSDQHIDFIKEKKIDGKTAIPAGRYKIAISFSNRFQKYLPELIGVPGYAGIRIHPGNTAEDTEGCLLPGQKFGVDMVSNSKPAFNYLFSLLQAAEKKEKMYITIK